MAKLPAWMPTSTEFFREAIIVMGGALIAVAIVNSLPAQWKRLFAMPTAPADPTL